MNEQNRPYVWQMIRDAVDALGTPTTNVVARDWILERYPGTNKSTIQCQITVCTVNHASRVHYPENQKPRRCNTRYDFLYRPDRGMLERYERQRHGDWEIHEGDDGELIVRPVDGENELVGPDAVCV